jgi:LysM repeat protein
MPEAAHSSARILAPVALIGCAIAFFAVILSSDAGDDGGSNTSTPSSQTRTSTAPEVVRPKRRNYTVKTGDTLGGIAVRTGVEVERLQELNPELDPQALVAGQKIKLRE